MRFSIRVYGKSGLMSSLRTWSPWKARRFLDQVLDSMILNGDQGPQEVIVWMGKTVLYRTTAWQYRMWLAEASWN